MLKNLIVIISALSTLFVSAQISQNDTTICIGATVNLSVTLDTCNNVIFNQTKNILNSWTIGPNVNLNNTYKVFVSGTYSLLGGCQNVNDPAYFTGVCGYTTGSPYNGGPLPVGKWWIQNQIGIRPDNDVFGGANGVYVYTINPSVSPLQFSFADNNYSDNSGALNFSVEEISIDSVVWSTGSNNSTISVTPTVTTTYYCNRYHCNQMIQDSVTIFVNPPDTTNLTVSSCNSYSWNGTVYNQSGTYTNLFTNILGCDSLVTLDLTINSIPTEPIVYVSNDIYLSTDIQENASYQWILCSDSIIIQNETQPTLTAPFNGIFGVIVTNACGSDTSNCQTVVNVGLETLNQIFSLFPNPTNDQMTISVDESLIGKEYSIFDQVGKLVAKGSLINANNKLFLNRLSNGIYTLQIEGKGRKTFVVQKD